MTAALDTARMLASLLDVDENEATAKLARKVAILYEPRFEEWAREIAALVARTVDLVDQADNRKPDVQVLIGNVAAVGASPSINVAIGSDRLFVGTASAPSLNGYPSCLFAAATAPIVAAVAVRAAVGDARLPHCPDPLDLGSKEFGIPPNSASQPILLDGAVLIGAGAVAHGFLRALRGLDVRGRLDIVDPKIVGAGNLNRCLYLRPGDEGAGKARLLAERAAPDLPGLDLYPSEIEFAEFMRGRRLPIETMIVTVDSRGARRKLQKFIPRRVLDASTTDVREVVVHSNEQPADGACMACLYRHTPNEEARTLSIAEGLGIEIATVGEGFVSAEAAQRIAVSHPAIEPASIEGKAFDTLFRELCATQALATNEGRQVLTPFAFVSGLAGALLAVELVRKDRGLPDTGGWHVDPWRGPVGRLRRPVPKHPDCEFCSKPHFRAAIDEYWSKL